VEIAFSRQTLTAWNKTLTNNGSHWTPKKLIFKRQQPLAIPFSTPSLRLERPFTPSFLRHQQCVFITLLYLWILIYSSGSDAHQFQWPPFLVQENIQNERRAQTRRWMIYILDKHLSFFSTRTVIEHFTFRTHFQRPIRHSACCSALWFAAHEWKVQIYLTSYSFNSPTFSICCAYASPFHYAWRKIDPKSVAIYSFWRSLFSAIAFN